MISHAKLEITNKASNCFLNFSLINMIADPLKTDSLGKTIHSIEDHDLV